MTRLFYIFSIILILHSCKDQSASTTTQEKEQSTALTAQQIVDKAIATAGGSVIENSTIHFKFRDYYYNATRANGSTTLDRCKDPECILQQDKIKENGEFVRFRESVPVAVPDSMAPRYSNSINSVKKAEVMILKMSIYTGLIKKIITQIILHTTIK